MIEERKEVINEKCTFKNLREPIHRKILQYFEQKGIWNQIGRIAKTLLDHGISLKPLNAKDCIATAVDHKYVE